MQEKRVKEIDGLFYFPSAELGKKQLMKAADSMKRSQVRDPDEFDVAAKVMNDAYNMGDDLDNLDVVFSSSSSSTPQLKDGNEGNIQTVHEALNEKWTRLSKAQKIAEKECGSCDDAGFDFTGKKAAQLEELVGLQESAERMLANVAFVLKYKKEIDGKPFNMSEAWKSSFAMETMIQSLVAGVKCLRALYFCKKDGFW